MLDCDKCSGKIQEGAKFCPHCGDPVTEADKQVSAISATAEANVEISFGKSTSASYEQAVNICKNIPTYKESGEGKATRHDVQLAMSEVELVINIWELVGSWKSSKLLINGQPATKKALVYKSVGCFRGRQKAFDREQYCYGAHHYDSNIWGCKQLSMPLSQWGGGWLEYGTLDKGGIWHFDKDRIRHELEQKIHDNELCPVLDRQNIIRTLESLPDKINPKNDSDWEYATQYEEVGGTFKDVAVGIRPVVKRANRYVLGDYRPSWDFDEEGQSGEGKTLTYEINLGESSQPKKQETKNKAGCMGVLAIGVIVIIGGLSALFF